MVTQSPTFANINGTNSGTVIPTAIPTGGGFTTPVPTPPVTPTQSTDQTAADTALANQGKSGYDAFGNPIANTTATDHAGNSVSTTQANGDTYTGQDGKQYYISTGQPVQTSTAADTSIGTNNGTTNTDPNAPALADPTDRAALAQAQADYQATAKQVQDAITNISNGTTPLSAGEQAQVDGLKQQFQTLIDQQTQQNTGAFGTAQMRGYQSGAAEYDPTFQAKTIGSVVSAGLAKISDLQVKEASAVAQLTQSLKANDISAIKDAYSVYQDASKARQDALQKTIDDTQTAIKSAQDAKIVADKVVYDTVTKPITDIVTKAAENGADAATLAKIKGAQTVTDAIAAAGTSIQTSTNPDIAQYLFYKQQAQQSGVVPQSYEEYQKVQAQIAASAAYSKAYATAKGTAAGTAAGLPPSDTPTPTGLGGDTKGGSILAQTGLSIGAFNYLTQGTASMSRMTAAQRSAIMGEAQNYLNKTGTDVSTFQSQYKAYNDVLQKNIARANNTKIMAGEVSGSADALIAAIQSQGGSSTSDTNPGNVFAQVQGMGGLKAANVLDLMLGNQTNNKFAQTYKTQITFMANDLAGYLAAARGASSPELQDQRDAAQVISNGMNTGSVTAFRDAINANEAKVANVVNNSVSSTQKQVWGLFGVADKYASPTNAADSLTQQGQEYTQKVNNYIQANPDKLDTVTTLYNNNFTDEQVVEYLNL